MNRLRDPRWLLILIFLGIIGGVPLAQMLIEARQEEGVRAFELFSRAPTAANLRAYERDLESSSWAARVTRPGIQFAQFAWFGYGGAKAVVGSDGWYFYKPGLNYMLTRPGLASSAGSTNDPLPAIVDFRDQLEARGLVARHRSKKDRRVVDLALTAEGKAVAKALTPRMVDLSNEVLKDIPASEVNALIDILKRLIERFDEIQPVQKTRSAR